MWQFSHALNPITSNEGTNNEKQQSFCLELYSAIRYE
jgi:hypothetical protein